MKKALIFWGGWDGHEPQLVSRRFGKMLERNGFEVEIREGLDCIKDKEKLLEYDLLVSCVTMSEIPDAEPISYAVSHGVGLAGCHGGMCDSFRQCCLWQFITGGQWVSHPGGNGIDYMVNVRKGSSPIVEGIDDFPVCSEHYYMHIDPAIEVLATTRFPLVNSYHAANKPVDMPVAWTKYWGHGRVFYCSLGHHDDVFDKSPSAAVLMERGMLWAAEGREYAKKNNLDPKCFTDNLKNF
ncbi:MAG: ThuA domain-containing protein [Acutalibacteraceae bacterium]|nr:ThuA domain-containing protein [Acutalibacteraceae bacterium]